MMFAATIAVVITVASSFYLPALRLTHGLWPAPLDDVYIHYGFARAASLGHPFEWYAGSGYSSGSTSLTYPLVLAPGFWLGFRGPSIGVFAAIVACACLVDFAWQLRTLARSLRVEWLGWVAAPLVVAVPLLDWSWFSGMETALFGAVLGRTIVASHRAMTATPDARGSHQLRAGLWCALLVATRPEVAPLAWLLGLAVAHAAGSLSIVSTLLRSEGPLALFLAVQALANRALTSEWSAAGAVRKLYFTNPYASGTENAIEIIKNLFALRQQAFVSALGGPPWCDAVLLLAGAALFDKRTRRLGISLLLGSFAALLLVSLNSTARFQHLRYATPSLAMLLAAAFLGASSLTRRGWLGRVTVLVALAVVVLAPARTFPVHIDHFARASRNIAEQQVEVGRQLAVQKNSNKGVFLSDAGAIPFVSGLRALDGLGLGGHGELPFARASVHGIPAVIELIERLELGSRPDVLAVYPSWWPDLVDRFGKRISSVKIEDNVICGGDEVVLYDADWSLLEARPSRRIGEIDAVDVADLVDERAHRYAMPTTGGWVIGEAFRDGSGARRYDAGRIVPEGESEAFELRAASTKAELVMRTDSMQLGELEVVHERGDRRAATLSVDVPARVDDAWTEIRVPLADVAVGDVVRLHARRGAWRGFHAWLLDSVEGDRAAPIAK